CPDSYRLRSGIFALVAGTVQDYGGTLKSWHGDRIDRQQLDLGPGLDPARLDVLAAGRDGKAHAQLVAGGHVGPHVGRVRGLGGLDAEAELGAIGQPERAGLLGGQGHPVVVVGEGDQLPAGDALGEGARSEAVLAAIDRDLTVDVSHAGERAALHGARGGECQALHYFTPTRSATWPLEKGPPLEALGSLGGVTGPAATRSLLLAGSGSGGRPSLWRASLGVRRPPLTEARSSSSLSAGVPASSPAKSHSMNRGWGSTREMAHSIREVIGSKVWRWNMAFCSWMPVPQLVERSTSPSMCGGMPSIRQTSETLNSRPATYVRSVFVACQGLNSNCLLTKARPLAFWGPLTLASRPSLIALASLASMSSLALTRPPTSIPEVMARVAASSWARERSCWRRNRVSGDMARRPSIDRPMTWVKVSEVKSRRVPSPKVTWKCFRPSGPHLT